MSELQKRGSADSRGSMRSSLKMMEKEGSASDSRDHVDAKNLADRTDSGRQEMLDQFMQGNYAPTQPSSLQRRARNLAISLPWLALQLTAILVDVVAFIVGIFGDVKWTNGTIPLVVNWATSIVYILDLSLRIFAFRPHVFFSKGKNWFDFIVVILTTIFAIMSTFLSDRFILQPGGLRVLRIFQVARLIRLGVVLGDGQKFRAARRITGQNKLRFVSASDDFDIDLTYITDRLIAMGVPATGCAQFYRNPLEEIVRFFNLYHSGGFHIMNFCPELPYDPAAFGVNPRTRGSNVDAFVVQDHTPPTILQFIEFLTLSREWMAEDKENVLAVHCKGGKGRTGSVCCAWLLYMGEAQTVQDSLNFFGLGRTDIRQASSKVQGVETPSQVRYVGYYAKLLEDWKIKFPDPIGKPPEAEPLVLESLTLHDVFLPPMADNVVVAVHVDHNAAPRGKRVIFWSQSGSTAETKLQIFLGATKVSGDMRISVFDAKKVEDAKKRMAEEEHILAGTEPGCLFYFLFHTHFHQGVNELEIEMEDVDKAWKKLGKQFSKDGKLVMGFKDAVAMPAEGA